MCRKRRQRHLSGFQIESFLNTAHLGNNWKYMVWWKHMKLFNHSGCSLITTYDWWVWIIQWDQRSRGDFWLYWRVEGGQNASYLCLHIAAHHISPHIQHHRHTSHITTHYISHITHKITCHLFSHVVLSETASSVDAIAISKCETLNHWLTHWNVSPHPSWWFLLHILATDLIHVILDGTDFWDFCFVQI